MKLLTSKRLILKPISSSDIGDIHLLHSLPEVNRFNTLGMPENLQKTEEVVEKWLMGNDLIFKIELKSEGNFIGIIALHIGNPKFERGEAWYKLHPNFWNNGYATEALNRIIHFGFDQLKLHRIEAGCAVENLGSIKVLEKAGMKKEGRKRQSLPLKSGWSDSFEYAIIVTDLQ